MATRKKFIFRRSALYRRVFETPAGQRVLADICANCGVLMPIPGHDGSAALSAGGKQAAALEILGILKKDPNEVWDLMEDKTYDDKTEPVDKIEYDED